MQHGGHANAFTSMEQTNYHLEVSWEHLDPALDRCNLVAYGLCEHLSRSQKTTMSCTFQLF